MSQLKPEQIVQERLRALSESTEGARVWLAFMWYVIRAGVAQLATKTRSLIRGAIDAGVTFAWDSIDYITPRFALSVFVIPMLMLIPILVYTNVNFALTWLDTQAVGGVQLHWYYYYMLLGICAVILINTDHPHALAFVVFCVQLYAVILLGGVLAGDFSIVALTAIIYLAFGSLCALGFLKFAYRLKTLEGRLARLTIIAIEAGSHDRADT